MVETIRKKCLQCKDPIDVRVVDHKRGLGKFCSLSCSSKHRAKIERKQRGTNCECAQCGKAFCRFHQYSHAKE